jgi:hypothetical protein
VGADSGFQRDGRRKGARFLNPLIAADGRRVSRAALLAGASLVVLATLAVPGAAQAACGGGAQTISGPTPGPINATGGDITVKSGGIINGHPTGVAAFLCQIGTLSNSGQILGGPGGEGLFTGTGGNGVANGLTIKTLTNNGLISGGVGGTSLFGGGDGGAGVANEDSATIGTLTNGPGRTIVGGTGGTGRFTVGGGGGAGISNSGTITTLSNQGTISGGVGGGSETTGGTGGAGVSNAATITTMTVSAQGTIEGGGGGSGVTGGVGGAGVANFGTIGSSKIAGSGLMNLGSIVGGGAAGSDGGAGGVGLSNSGTIAALTNKGMIAGGGGAYFLTAGAGGAGLVNSSTITTLTNEGMIIGGQGGPGVPGGDGGTGLVNSGTIGTLTNNKLIIGGQGGFAETQGGNGGAGITNTGTITALTNTGKILVGQGGPGGQPGVAGIDNLGSIGTLNNSGTIDGPGFAIISAGSIGPSSIGPINNTGQIIGNVEIDQSKVVVTGGSDKTFGSWSGGTITIAGDLKFAGGNTELGDNILVDDGTGTVTNEGVLRLAAPETIFGNFDQGKGGVLEFQLAGDAFGQYGALDVTKDATLDGELALDLINGFYLANGDRFDLMTFGIDPGSFAGVSLDGVACTGGLSDVWNCGQAGFNLDFNLTAGGLDMTVASIPEPSTWALMATGFLGLAGLRLRAGRRTAPP